MNCLVCLHKSVTFYNVFVVCVNGVCVCVCVCVNVGILRVPYVFTCDGGSATVRVYTFHQNFIVECHLKKHICHLRKNLLCHKD